VFGAGGIGSVCVTVAGSRFHGKPMAPIDPQPASARRRATGSTNFTGINESFFIFEFIPDHAANRCYTRIVAGFGQVTCPEWH
jgi:hypothetical protein